MTYDPSYLAHLLRPSFLLFLFLLAALVYTAKTSYRLYKNDGAGTLGLAVSCMSGGLFLFMTVVPAFTVLMTT